MANERRRTSGASGDEKWNKVLDVVEDKLDHLEGAFWRADQRISEQVARGPLSHADAVKKSERNHNLVKKLINHTASKVPAYHDPVAKAIARRATKENRQYMLESIRHSKKYKYPGH